MQATTSVIAWSALLLGCSSSTTPAGGDGGTPDATDANVGDAAPLTTGVSTLAGAADPGDADGPRGAARFANPVNVVRGEDGTLYVADFDNGQIRAVDAAGTTTTVVHQAGFSRPFGMAWLGGQLYVETDNDPQGMHSATSGTLWRVAVATARAPGALATALVVATGLGRPRGLAALTDGRLALADELRHTISVLDPSNGRVTLLAGAVNVAGYADGAAASARFTRPYGIAARPDGMLVVADQGNQRLRLVDPTTGLTSTLGGAGTAGYVDGPLASACFNQPQGLVIDLAGDVFVTDLGNFRVRRVRGGQVTTVAGDGVGAYLDAADPLAGEFYGLEGLAIAPDGATLYVADGSRGEVVPFNRVRRVMLP